MASPSQTTREFPKPISFRKLIGPSFVILALGLGSGEVILWPYLASNYGLGIAWGAILGITFQYFINMEIERYALVRGESVFVGIAKFWKSAPYWFIVSTFVGFGLPGIIAASAHVLATVLGIETFEWLAIALLIAIGFILSSGRTVYGLMEKLTQSIILIGVPLILILTVMLSAKADWSALLAGMVGQGEGYAFFPEGLVLATFLAAFAYSGAGGNLNLTQSIYVKEKGYGMGAYAMKLAGLFRKKGVRENIVLEGASFDDTPQARARFRVWWRRVSLEHAIVFWFIGGVSILLLMLLSYVTAYELNGNHQGIAFVLREGLAIGQALSPIFGTGFLLVVAVMLFQTQLGVLDSTSRIMSENAAISYMKAKGVSTVPLSKMYFAFLWGQIAFGVLLLALGFSEPTFLIILGACMNAIAMFVHIGLVSWLNFKSIPTFYQPSVVRRILLGVIFLFFGVFSSVVVIDQLF